MKCRLKIGITQNGPAISGCEQKYVNRKAHIVVAKSRPFGVVTKTKTLEKSPNPQQNPANLCTQARTDWRPRYNPQNPHRPLHQNNTEPSYNWGIANPHYQPKTATRTIANSKHPDATIQRTTKRMEQNTTQNRSHTMQHTPQTPHSTPKPTRRTTPRNSTGTPYIHTGSWWNNTSTSYEKNTPSTLQTEYETCTQHTVHDTQKEGNTWNNNNTTTHNTTGQNTPPHDTNTPLYPHYIQTPSSGPLLPTPPAHHKYTPQTKPKSKRIYSLVYPPAPKPPQPNPANNTSNNRTPPHTTTRTQKTNTMTRKTQHSHHKTAQTHEIQSKKTEEPPLR